MGLRYEIKCHIDLLCTLLSRALKNLTHCEDVDVGLCDDNSADGIRDSYGM